VLVKENHGNGVAVTDAADQLINYNGTELKVNVGA
jgi:hypothetical protein